MNEIVAFLLFSESIFGYKDLRVNIYCTAAKLLTYVGIEFSERITPQKSEGVVVSIQIYNIS